MKKVKIADVTLYNKELDSKYSMSFKEKLTVARELDRLNIDVIEMPEIINPQQDSLLIKTLSSLLKNSTISCRTGSTAESVEEAWHCVSSAVHPRLHIDLPVSTVQMEYFSHIKPGKMLELIAELTKKASTLCEEVEFSAGDATRADFEFLCSAIKAAIANGASIITVCDPAGTMLPNELAEYISSLYVNVPELTDVSLSVQCSNELGAASSCAISAVLAGACQIKTAVSSCDCPLVTEMVHIIKVRGDSLGISSDVDATAINRAVAQMTWFSQPTPATSAFSGMANVTDGSEDIRLDSTVDITALSQILDSHGYGLSENDLTSVFHEFSRIVAEKTIGMKELDAIVAGTAVQVPPTYTLGGYMINNINLKDEINATANIMIRKNGETLRGLSLGNGPIDASFLAIEQIIGHHYELDDFQIYAVTEGREAMGKTVVKLRSGSRVFSGQGLSTDIIGSSIRAYIDALNKIVYEENIG